MSLISDANKYHRGLLRSNLKIPFSRDPGLAALHVQALHPAKEHRATRSYH